MTIFLLVRMRDAALVEFGARDPVAQDPAEEPANPGERHLTHHTLAERAADLFHRPLLLFSIQKIILGNVRQLPCGCFEIRRERVRLFGAKVKYVDISGLVCKLDNPIIREDGHCLATVQILAPAARSVPNSLRTETDTTHYDLLYLLDDYLVRRCLTQKISSLKRG